MILVRHHVGALQLRDGGDGRTLVGPIMPWGVEAVVLDRGSGIAAGFDYYDDAVEATEALEQLRALWHGHRIAVHVTHAAPGPGIDTPEDLARVRALFAAKPTP